MRGKKIMHNSSNNVVLFPALRFPQTWEWTLYLSGIEVVNSIKVGPIIPNNGSRSLIEKNLHRLRCFFLSLGQYFLLGAFHDLMRANIITIKQKAATPNTIKRTNRKIFRRKPVAGGNGSMWKKMARRITLNKSN